MDTLICSDTIERHITLRDYLQKTLQILAQSIETASKNEGALSPAATLPFVFADPAHLRHLIRLMTEHQEEGLDLFANVYLTLLHKYVMTLCGASTSDLHV